jgi:hypothetical protein
VARLGARLQGKLVQAAVQYVRRGLQGSATSAELSSSHAARRSRDEIERRQRLFFWYFTEIALVPRQPRRRKSGRRSQRAFAAGSRGPASARTPVADGRGSCSELPEVGEEQRLECSALGVGRFAELRSPARPPWLSACFSVVVRKRAIWTLRRLSA